MFKTTDFDVLICGGGLAGLTLARQLRLELPELSVAVIDRLSRPLPEAAFKVGESSIELGSSYFGKVLKLDEYFQESHLFKLGLRFFIGQSQGPIEDRPEAGISLFPPIPSYQIDRGRLENDLRRMDEEMGVIFFEGIIVEDIQLGEEDERHVVKCRQRLDKDGFLLTCRWVIDALGRRRLLQSKLGLKREHGHRASAAWWRYGGRVDVNDLAMSRDAHRWRSSIVEQRYYSTNHLTNTGYWVWLIPLGSGATSVGIVTDESIHPQHTYGQSYKMALEWLHEHEPALWEHIYEREPMDFLSLKNYSYTSAQVYSRNRWSCVGEAGFFLDPLYSVGSDFIAMGNTITVEMIRREREGALTEDTVETYNRLVLDVLFNIGLAIYRGTYCTLGHAQIYTSKMAWDIAVIWAFACQVYFQGLIRNPSPELLAIGQRYRDLNDRVQQLFADWSRAAPPRAIHVRGDLARMHFLQLLYLDLETSRNPAQTLEVMHRNLDRFEELAQVLFWQAVQECYPEHPILRERPWINAWRIVLDPKKWSEQGMFHATTGARPLDAMQKNFTGIFAPQSLREFLFYDLMYHIIHWRKGFIQYHIVPAVRKLLIVDKPAMWVRKLFVRDYPAHPGSV